MSINLAPILLVFVAIVIIISAIKGFTRGISRQVIRMITIIASIVLSFIIARSLYPSLIKFLDGKTMSDVIAQIARFGIFGGEAELDWLNNLDIETIELALTLPMALIIMPFTFVAAFLSISAVLLIIHAILCALFGLSKSKNNAFTRLLGLVLGVVQGAVVAGILLTPVVGICSTVGEAVDVLNEDAPTENTTAMLTETYDKYLSSIGDNTLFKAYSTLGVSEIYISIATVDIDGTEFDSTKLIPDVAMICGKAFELKGCDYKKLSSENEESITAIVNTVDGNAYIEKVCAGTIKTFANFYTSIAGNEARFGEPIDSIVLTSMDIFKETDETAVVADFTTIRDVYFILSRDNVLIAYDNGSDALLAALTQRDTEGVTTISKVIDTINKNERTKKLTTLMTQLSIAVIGKQAGLDDKTLTLYNNFVADLNNGPIKINKSSYATEEEYIAAISESLGETFTKNNMSVESEITYDMAKYISENYGDKNEITNEEANDIILSYYDSYLKSK